MENLYGLTPLHFLKFWIKMENIHGLTRLHLVEIWLKVLLLDGLYIYLKSRTFANFETQES